MSEEKMYAVKNDEGEWADTKHIFGPYAWATPDKTECEEEAKRHGGHVVTLIEEPEKVVLSKEQAKIVDDAHVHVLPACYISEQPDDEELLMKAYVNGYTVVREKRYLVYKMLGGKQKHEYFAQAYQSTVNPGTVSWLLNSKVQSDSLAQFTEAEIEHYGLQDCEKVEVTDDGE